MPSGFADTASTTPRKYKLVDHTRIALGIGYFSPNKQATLKDENTNLISNTFGFIVAYVAGCFVGV